MANSKKMDQVILGLLSHENLTGYDIKKRIDGALKFFWGGSYGSIYPTLSQLEDEGKVMKEYQLVSGRERIEYSITTKGRDSLRQWLVNPVEKDELRYETLLKLYLGNGADMETARVHIKGFEEKCIHELGVLRMYEYNLKNNLNEEDHKYYYLTVRFGIRTYEAYIEWCDEALKQIDMWK